MNWGKHLIQMPPPFPMSRAAFCPINCPGSTAMFDSTVTQYSNLHNFRPEKGVSDPLRQNVPTWEWSLPPYDDQGMSYQEIPVNRSASGEPGSRPININNSKYSVIV